jgi:hypothetical protein
LASSTCEVDLEDGDWYWKHDTWTLDPNADKNTYEEGIFRFLKSYSPVPKDGDIVEGDGNSDGVFWTCKRKVSILIFKKKVGDHFVVTGDSSVI